MKFHYYDYLVEKIYRERCGCRRLSPRKENPLKSTFDTDLQVGERIRRLRKARSRSLKEVALRSGLSSSYLSQLERGLSSASIRALARLADALDIGIAELFSASDPPYPDSPTKVARLSDRKFLEFPTTGMTKELLTPFDKSPRLDIYILTIAVGGGTGESPFMHQGEEARYVLEGGVELTVDGQKVILGAGDSFRFSSNLPHGYRNAGTKPAKAVWINYRDK